MRSKGFTLLETLIYIALLSGIMLGILGILNFVTRLNAKQNVKVEVDRNIDFISRRLTQLGLDAKCVYPYPTSSVLGYDQAGATTPTGSFNVINISPFTMPSKYSGLASSISVYVGSVGAAGSNNYQMAIYNDEGGAPTGTAIATTAAGTLTASSKNTLTFSAPPSLEAGRTYWLAYNTNGTDPSLNNFKYTYDASPPSSRFMRWKTQTYGSWPNPYGMSTETNARTATPSFSILFTEKAKPIPPSVPTSTGLILGKSTVGALTESNPANTFFATPFTVSTAHNGKTSSISINIATVDASPNNKYKMAIYSDNDGAPGALIAQSGIGTLDAGWNSLPIPAVLGAGKTYWLTYTTNGNNTPKYDLNVTDAGLLRTKSATFSEGSWPILFGAPSSQSGKRHSVYLTYDTTPLYDTVPCPTPSIATTTDSVAFTIANVEHRIYLENGRIKLREGSSQPEDLTTLLVTTDRSETSTPLFTIVDNSVQMRYKIKYNDEGNEIFKYEKPAQVSISVR